MVDSGRLQDAVKLFYGGHDLNALTTVGVLARFNNPQIAIFTAILSFCSFLELFFEKSVVLPDMESQRNQLK